MIADKTLLLVQTFGRSKETKLWQTYLKIFCSIVS